MDEWMNSWMNRERVFSIILVLVHVLVHAYVHGQKWKNLHLRTDSGLLNLKIGFCLEWKELRKQWQNVREFH